MCIWSILMKSMSDPVCTISCALEAGMTSTAPHIDACAKSRNTARHHARCAHVTSQQNQDIGILKTPNFDLAKFKRCSKGSKDLKSSSFSRVQSSIVYALVIPRSSQWQAVPVRSRPISHRTRVQCRAVLRSNHSASATLSFANLAHNYAELCRASNASKVAVLKVLISVSGEFKTPGEFLPYLIVPIVELHWSDRLTDLCGLFFSFFSIFARVQWHLVALIDTKNICTLRRLYMSVSIAASVFLYNHDFLLTVFTRWNLEDSTKRDVVAEVPFSWNRPLKSCFLLFWGEGCANSHWA